MKTKIMLLVIGCTVVSFCASTSLAMDVLGPPAAGLEAGKWSIGADYSHTRMDLDLHNIKEKEVPGGRTDLASFKLKHFKTDTVTADIGYGFTNNWEGFLRLGGVKTHDGKGLINSFGGLPFSTENGDTGFVLGAGTKATFWQRDNLKVGGIFQLSWLNADCTTVIDWGGGDISPYDTELNLMEIQIAVGPTYKLADWISVYGGPFLHYVDGDMKAEYKEPGYSDKITYDITQVSYFGGFIGVQVELVKNVPFNIEWQHTATDDAVAMNLIFRF
jgi:hypothetical protein